MELLIYKDIYTKIGEKVSVENAEQITSSTPKNSCPLYGAFSSEDGSRTLSKIINRNAITIDIDDMVGDDTQVKRTISLLIKFLYNNLNTYIIHETHSSKKDNRRVRIIVPINGIPKNDYRKLSYAFCKDMISVCKLEDKLEIDKKTYEPQQLMYFIPSNKLIRAVFDGENNIEHWLAMAKTINFEEEPSIEIPTTKVRQDDFLNLETEKPFYKWLSDKGICYFLDRYFTEDYQIRRQLPNGEIEYKYLNSKKPSGVRVNPETNILVTWHDGDPNTDMGNGARRANIYHLLKNKGVIEEVYSLYVLEKSI